MKRYELASGIFFTLLALVQLTRILLAWPVQLAGIQIPIWVSAVACFIAIKWWDASDEWILDFQRFENELRHARRNLGDTATLYYPWHPDD